VVKGRYIKTTLGHEARNEKNFLGTRKKVCFDEESLTALADKKTKSQHNLKGSRDTLSVTRAFFE